MERPPSTPRPCGCQGSACVLDLALVQVRAAGGAALPADLLAQLRAAHEAKRVLRAVR